MPGPPPGAPAVPEKGAEELADRLMWHDRTLTEAEALEEGAQAREVALEVMEDLLTDTEEDDA